MKNTKLVYAIIIVQGYFKCTLPLSMSEMTMTHLSDWLSVNYYDFISYLSGGFLFAECLCQTSFFNVYARKLHWKTMHKIQAIQSIWQRYFSSPLLHFQCHCIQDLISNKFSPSLHLMFLKIARFRDIQTHFMCVKYLLTQSMTLLDATKEINFFMTSCNKLQDCCRLFLNFDTTFDSLILIFLGGCNPFCCWPCPK